MQLKRIQLNGFKSFVDPTSIPVMSNMNAIVGPNGCGKSNIVDAIRWVSGEMSAKQLRGQSMSDVIFNGTSGRKPIGKATVELTFDNSDRRITGEYAAFSEIAIRREVVRDDQSAYFINGVPARRRDLVDLFLGTGLGPRSYAIIEQGMISQLVEAKPEELRTHLEEVAGISKYRERRRETETRIRHTQENLDRLNDVREELEKQLRHLERQSHAAEKYKILQAELRLLHAQMKALQWKNYENQFAAQKEKMSELDVEHESRVAQLRECETVIEKTRLNVNESMDQKSETQKLFYGAGAEIARLEQQIAHKQEQIKQWEYELKQSSILWEELSQQETAQASQIKTLTEEVNALKPQAEAFQQALNDANAILLDAENVMRACQQDWDQYQQQSAQTNQQLEVAKNNIRHVENQKQQAIERRAQLQAESQSISLGDLSDALSPIAQKTDALKQAITDIQEALLQLSQAITAQRAIYQASQAALTAAQGELQKLEARQASLHALQQAQLQDQKADIRPWLEKHGIKNQPKLGKMIQVEAGWERAVEVILKPFFDALCVANFNMASDLTEGKITLLQEHHAATARLSQKTVCDIIENNSHLPSWVSTIYIAENITEALSLRSQLLDSESIVTRDGQWMGKNWIQLTFSDNSEESFLIREKQLKVLSAEIQTQQEKITQLQLSQQSAQSELEKLEATRDAKHKTFQETTAAFTITQANLSAKQSTLEAVSQQQQRLQTEIAQIESQLAQCETALTAANTTVAEQELVQSEQLKQRDVLLSARSAAENALTAARLDAQAKKQQADERLIRLTSNENQLAVLLQTSIANQKQLLQLSERRETLSAQLSQSDTPLTSWQQELQSALSQRVIIENRLSEIEKALQSLQAALREHENTCDVLSQSIADLQETQQQYRMQLQEMTVRQTTLQEQLQEMQFELDPLLRELPQDANSAEWENRATLLQNKIDRLGPINLAAIEEFKTCSERKVYMDKQVTDLTESLEILQNAIRKIDRETRHLFKDTFDKVNQNFQQLFPRVFSGGQASLELTEEDLLTTGIIVRAQPPGKRNATIHMLSGGEKTLTAIALMFSMFQMNPAPFCVLDEVDAPLDDLNVSRFCQLVKEMSSEIQFLIISHNKVTIEMADHLMGVTMREPGVSRIVSVDIQEAVEMVA